MLGFERLAGAGAGPRRGRLTLDHGIVETPAFMPVGTNGTVKAIGPEALAKFSVIVGSPADVARQMVTSMSRVRSFRRASNDSYNFNWLLEVPPALQQPFEPTHAAMRALNLRREPCQRSPPHPWRRRRSVRPSLGRCRCRCR